MTETTPAAPERLGLESLDVAAERIERLREDFPEVFREGKIDFDALKRSLGEWVDPGKERFGLTWPGKAACMRVIQQPSVGTLVPDRAESVDFDTTQNVIVEGENLEVLKLLQKSYYGKVKMIYIDPPYNTGNDFIYPDNFREGLEDYLLYSGQIDGEGFSISTNTESEGRFHTNWLNMMYPRLYLARNLLRDDGVLLVSMNDVEIARLRIMLDEIFGEDNFVEQFVWINEGNVDQQSKFKGVHEYIVCYARQASLVPKPTIIDPNVDRSSKLFNETIENTLTKNGRANPPSEIVLPVGFPADFENGVIEVRDDRWPHILDTVKVNDGKLTESVRVFSGWSSRNLLDSFIRTGCSVVIDSEGKDTWFKLTSTGAIYAYKRRSEAQGHVLSVIRNVGTSKQNSAILAQWGFDFPFPKPVLLVKYIVEVFAGTDKNSLILDLFAGSGTLGEAVVNLNSQDQGKRKYILVQLPEPLNEDRNTSIATIARERMRRCGRIPNGSPDQLGLESILNVTLGFRAYRLTESNFVPWKGGGASEDTAIEQQIALFADNLLPDRTSEDILTEILLKSGYALTVPVARLSLAGKEVFSVADGALLVCLDRTLTIEVIEAMAALDPAQIICLDAGFAGDDALKVNAMQTIKARQNTLFKVV